MVKGSKDWKNDEDWMKHCGGDEIIKRKEAGAQVDWKNDGQEHSCLHWFCK